jgi:hypothetical protein
MPETTPSSVPSSPPADHERGLEISDADLYLLRALLIWPLLVWAIVIFLLV